jgi:acyl-coenzyme A thioesterase PaaI-like protein
MTPQDSDGLELKGHEMIDGEMELVARLGDVDSLPDEAFEQARAVLQGAIALEDDRRMIEIPRRPKRRRRTTAVQGGVAAGVAAAVAALALVATSPGPSPKVSAPPNHIASPLVRLADYVSGSATPPGDAALVARTTTSGGKSVTVYDLYADNGQYFFSQTESGLAGQVTAQNNLGGGLFAREVAAAKLSATGDVQTAAQDMADAADPSNVISPTQTASSAAIAAKQAATGQVQSGNRFDNWVWEDSQDAIIAGSGDPQVRAGVLRILATLPDVTVTDSTSGGQPTLVLAAGTPELGYGYTEQLTINATTGIPVSFAGGAPGQTPEASVTYQVSRVTLSDIAAGKF